MKTLLALLCATLLASQPAAAAPRAPEDVIQATAGELATRLEGRREYLSEHPAELHQLVDEILLPNFDKRYAGFLVLGRDQWRAATPEQRNRFVEAFFSFLVRSYAGGLLDFDPGSLVILEAEAPPGSEAKRYMVKTENRLDNGKIVPVDYRLRLTKSGWKVYDVRIEGVSYLQNYRNQFNAEIDAVGLDALISRLERETAEVQRQGATQS